MISRDKLYSAISSLMRSGMSFSVGGSGLLLALGLLEAVNDWDITTGHAFSETVEALKAENWILKSKTEVFHSEYVIELPERRKEQKRAPELKKTRYLWLRNERDLTTDQKSRLLTLSTSFLKTAKAYQLKIAFQEFWNSSVRVAPLHMQIWYGWAIRSKVPDMMKAAQTIRKHAMGILHWFESRMTNGLTEAINGLIQAAKRRAYIAQPAT